MRIALAQIDPTVGDLAGNAARIRAACAAARDAGAELAVFPELAVTGYPPRDLLDLPSFVEHAQQTVRELAVDLPLPALVGHPARNPAPTGRGLFNAASLLEGGRVAATYHKQLLPTYDVFDEARYFAPGDGPCVVTCGGTRVGLSICEDIWNEAEFVGRPYPVDPVGELARAGAEVIVNLSASPWQLGKLATRRALFARQARQVGLPLLYCNQVGGNDELIFDGTSVAFDGAGALRAVGKRFAEDLLVVDTAALTEAQATGAPPLVPPVEPDEDTLLDALALGLGDYLRKTGFERVVIGLSGGIDSAVVCAVAVHTLGPERVLGVAMPSPFSSGHSVADAHALAAATGIECLTLPIAAVYEAYRATLAEPFAGTPFGVAEENLQARIRGGLLMALSNKRGHLLLTTGNKSELAVGYCTLYGDMCGGLAVISDVPKTLVYRLGQAINRRAGAEWIPRSTFDKPPSAELRPDQQDSDTLPDYAVLDAILEAFVERHASLEEIVADGHDPAVVEWVVRAVIRNEYKRWQAAPGLRVTSKAFGSGRRIPIAQGWRPTVPRR